MFQAETSEDLYEWKAALEEALANAPSGGALAMGQNGIFKNDQADGTDGSFEQCKLLILLPIRVFVALI